MIDVNSMSNEDSKIVVGSSITLLVSFNLLVIRRRGSVGSFIDVGSKDKINLIF